MPINSNDFTDGLLTGLITINSNTATFTRTLSLDLLTEGTEYFQAALLLLTDEQVALSDVVTVYDTSLTPPPDPGSLLPIIPAVDYNSIQSVISEILGTGENGYGLSDIASIPVAPITNRITAFQWNALLRDINVATTHITNTSTVTTSVITGTTVVTKLRTDILQGQANYLIDPVRRYTCHPNQYYVDPVTSSTVNYTDGISTRTLPWGVDVQSVTHKVNAAFATRLQARYFFNLGSYITLLPFHLNNGLNDLDAEWASFINHMQDTNVQYTYRRSDFMNQTSTSTVYNSGTLSISVLAEKAPDESNIEFTVTYGNTLTYDTGTNSALIVIIPTVGYWNILV